MLYLPGDPGPDEPDRVPPWTGRDVAQAAAWWLALGGFTLLLVWIFAR